jgi:acetyl esterase
MPLDPAAAAVMEAMTANFPDLGGTVTDATTAREILARAEPVPGQPVARVEDRVAEGVPVRIYWPVETGDPMPVVVYYHGGGFVICDLGTHDHVCRFLAVEAGAIVISVDYRLAPEHKYPAAVEDAYTAALWAAENAADLGGDPARLAVAGDSAGGNLAAVVSRLARDAGGEPAIAFQLLVYPATDMLADLPSRTENADGYFLTSTHMHWFAAQYFSDPAEVTEPDASPMRAESLAGLPPALVVTAEFDPLRDEGEAYAARMAVEGVAATAHRVPGGIPRLLRHGQLHPRRPRRGEPRRRRSPRRPPVTQPTSDSVDVGLPDEIGASAEPEFSHESTFVLCQKGSANLDKSLVVASLKPLQRINRDAMTEQYLIA